MLEKKLALDGIRATHGKTSTNVMETTTETAEIARDITLNPRYAKKVGSSIKSCLWVIVEIKHVKGILAHWHSVCFYCSRPLEKIGTISLGSLSCVCHII